MEEERLASPSPSPLAPPLAAAEPQHERLPSPSPSPPPLEAAAEAQASLVAIKTGMETNHSPVSRDANEDAPQRDLQPPAAAPAASSSPSKSLSVHSGTLSDRTCSQSTEVIEGGGSDSDGEGCSPSPVPRPGTTMIYNLASLQKGELYLLREFVRETFLPTLGLRDNGTARPLLDLAIYRRDHDGALAFLDTKIVDVCKTSGYRIPLGLGTRKGERLLFRKGDDVEMTYMGPRARRIGDPVGEGPIHRIKLVVPPARARRTSDARAGTSHRIKRAVPSADGESEKDESSDEDSSEEDEEDEEVWAQGPRRASTFSIPNSLPPSSLCLSQELLTCYLRPIIAPRPLVGTVLELSCRREGLGPHLATVEEAEGYAGSVFVGKPFRKRLGLAQGVSVRLLHTGQRLGDNNKPIFCFDIDREDAENIKKEQPVAENVAMAAEVAIPLRQPKPLRAQDPQPLPQTYPGRILRCTITSNPEKNIYVKAGFLKEQLLPTLGIRARKGTLALPRPIHVELQRRGDPAAEIFAFQIQPAGTPAGSVGRLCMPRSLLEALDFHRDDTLELEYTGRDASGADSPWDCVYSFIVDKSSVPEEEARVQQLPAPSALAAAIAQRQTAANNGASPNGQSTERVGYPGISLKYLITSTADPQRGLYLKHNFLREQLLPTLGMKIKPDRTLISHTLKLLVTVKGMPSLPAVECCIQRAGNPHGNAGTLILPASLRRVLQYERGDVVVMEYRGSTGSGSEDRVYSFCLDRVQQPFDGIEGTGIKRPLPNPASPLAPKQPEKRAKIDGPLHCEAEVRAGIEEAVNNGVLRPGANGSGSGNGHSRDPRLAQATKPVAKDSGLVSASAMTAGVSFAAAVSKSDWTRAAVRCARSLKAAREQVRRVLRCGGSFDISDDAEAQEEEQRRAHQAQAQYSLISQMLPADWAEQDIIVHSGAALPRHSVWCSTELPWLNDDQIAATSAFCGRVDKSMVALLQGKAPFRLWVGPVDGGSGAGAQGVVALEDIPVGAWVLPAVGEYVFGQNELSPLVLDIAAEGQDGCVVPHAAVTTAEQAAMYDAAEMLSAGLRRLPDDTALDCCRHGGAAAWLRESDEPNLGLVAVDLMTGPTTVFYFSTREIKKGEVLTKA